MSISQLKNVLQTKELLTEYLIPDFWQKYDVKKAGSKKKHQITCYLRNVTCNSIRIKCLRSWRNAQERVHVTWVNLAMDLNSREANHCPEVGKIIRWVEQFSWKVLKRNPGMVRIFLFFNKFPCPRHDKKMYTSIQGTIPQNTLPTSHFPESSLSRPLAHDHIN